MLALATNVLANLSAGSSVIAFENCSAVTLRNIMIFTFLFATTFVIFRFHPTKIFTKIPNEWWKVRFPLSQYFSDAWTIVQCSVNKSFGENKLIFNFLTIDRGAKTTKLDCSCMLHTICIDGITKWTTH